MYSIAMEQITREFSDYNYDYAITQQLLSGVQQKNTEWHQYLGSNNSARITFSSAGPLFDDQDPC